MAEIPFEVVGLDFDNGSEFLNQAVIEWAAGRQIYFTRPGRTRRTTRPPSSRRTTTWSVATASTTATTPPPNCGSSTGCGALVNDRLNYFTPTKKPIGWDADRNGKRRRIYDKPTTPLDRLLGAGVLSPAQEQELLDHRARLNPADLARRIHDEQSMLTKLSKSKTDQLRETTTKTTNRLPRTDRGVRLREPS